MRTAVTTRCALPVFLAMFVAGPSAGAEAPEWKIRAEASYVRTTGNTDTQTLGAKIDASREGQPNRYYAKGQGLFAEDDGDQTASRWLAQGRYERTITERFFGFLAATYLRDKFGGYEYRVTVGPGVGYDFLTGPAHKLKGLLGVLWAYDKFEEEGSDSYAVGDASLDYGWQIRENLKFQQFVGYQQSMEDSSVYFAKSETGFEVKATDRISLGLRYTVTYQNEPPADADETDTVFLTSLIVDF